MQKRGSIYIGRKKRYMSQFKAKVAFEAAKADKTISQIASEYGLIHRELELRKRYFSRTSILYLRKKIKLRS